MLYQRMYSDTDLWLGLKARQARYKNVLGATKELSPVEDESVTGSKILEQPDQKLDLGAAAKKHEQVSFIINTCIHLKQKMLKIVYFYKRNEKKNS